MKINYLRYAFIAFGLIFFFLAFKSFSNDVGGLSLDRSVEIITNISNVQWDLLIFFIAFGYIFVTIGFHWKKIFLKLSKVSIGIFVMLITFIIFIYPIHNSSQEIADSIQPTIDYMTADSVDKMLSEYIEPYNQEIEIVFSKNSQTQTYFVKNITPTQAQYLSQQMGIDLETDKERIALSKMMITSIYQEIEENSPELKEVPIPLDQVQDMVAQEVDLDLLTTIDVDLLETVFEYDQNAQITILISQGTQTKTVNPSNMKQENVNLIWNKLNLSQDTQKSTRKKTLEMLLATTANQLENSMPNTKISIPLDIIKHSFPQDMIYILSSEIMSDNISKRVEALQDIRQYCQENQLEESMGCSGIMITKYKNLMSMLSGDIENNNFDESFQMLGIDQEDASQDLGFNISKYNTIAKVEQEISDMTDYMFILSFLSILFIAIAFGFAFIDNKINKEEKSNIDLFKDLTKFNLYAYIPSFVLIVIIWYFIDSDMIIKITDSIVSSVPGSQTIDIMLLTQLPIYKILMSINSQALVLATVYLIISILLFIGFRFIILGLFFVLKFIPGSSVRNEKYNKEELDEDEKNAKTYIQKYKEEYSKDAIKKALTKSGMQEEKVENYINKYI